MDDSPEYANPFLAPEFARGRPAPGRGPRGDAARGRRADVGFLPYERGRLGIGRAIGLGLSDCQALVHRPGTTCATG
ncbi:hypothetical protein ACL07V_00960 [Streptomyces sp. MB22_4]|uniref:hypothetical protein n=1 Tax=Streptomyces sp. MB22_4 TaxID=3383120 RepID=UPI0039A01E98